MNMLERRKWLILAILNVILFNAYGLTAVGNSVQLEADRGNKITLKATSSEYHLELLVRAWRSLWRFAIFQGHSQHKTITLSTAVQFSYGYTYSGSNAAVLVHFDTFTWNSTLFLKAVNLTEDVKVDVIAVPYDGGAPLPGGCCLTCSMEFDPNIVISYSAVEINISFSFANVYFPKNGSTEGPPCDGNKVHGKKPEHYRLEYHVYQMFLPEDDLSEEAFFKGVEKMAYPAVIKTNGKKVTTVQAPNLPVVKLDSQRAGQGVVFNIIVNDPVTKAEAAYSPAVTYSCRIDAKVDSCQSLLQGDIVNGVFSVLGSLICLVLCFAGFRLFHLTLLMGGLVNFSFIFFIIITANSDMSHLGRILISAGIGLIFGLLILMLWWFTEWTRPCLLFDALFLGFLLGATLFFTPVGSLSVFQTSPFDYGAVLCCSTIVVPVVLILWPKALCIAYTSIVSAYGIVIGIDFFLHTSISYILIDVIIHATEPQYRSDHIYVTRPFQRNDYYLSGAWMLLSCLGCVVQYILTKDRPNFPRSGFLEQIKIRKFLSRRRANERTPLLINNKYGETGPNAIC